MVVHSSIIIVGTTAPYGQKYLGFYSVVFAYWLHLECLSKDKVKKGNASAILALSCNVHTCYSLTDLRFQCLLLFPHVLMSILE
jgi:hypothetical protein